MLLFGSCAGHLKIKYLNIKSDPLYSNNVQSHLNLFFQYHLVELHEIVMLFLFYVKIKLNV